MAMKTVLISALTFAALSFVQHIIFDSDILQTLKNEDVAVQANDWMTDLCVATNYRVLVYPNHQRVPDYGTVYDCEKYLNR